MYNRVIVLNYDYTYLNTIDWKRAVNLLIVGKAEAIKYSDTIIRTFTKSIKLPKVLRLVKLVRHMYRNKVPYNKKNLLVRDNFRCQYCGCKSEKLTVDHVIPRARGGKTNFENCVASCFLCNNKKDSRTPREANMFLKREPYSPTIMEFLIKRMKMLGIEDLLEDLGVYK